MEKPAKSKPKPPPYPRPVPEIFAEELLPTSADIVWQAKRGSKDGSEAEDEAEVETQADKRAAKRRRIEACARAYLRGEQLYIMSAQLKGPFQPGWKNPWSKRKQVSKSNVAGEYRSLEIPETTKKTSTRAEEDVTDKLAIAETDQQATSRESKIESGEHRVRNNRHPPSPFVDVATRAPKSPIDPGAKVPAKTREKRVEEWLRRNESFAKKSEVQVLSSPTPISKTFETPKQSQVADLAFRTSQSEPINRPERLSGELEPTTAADSNHTRRLSEVVGHVQKLSRDIQDVMNEPTASSSAALLDEVRRLANPAFQKRLDSSRAEFAILKARQALQRKAPLDVQSPSPQLGHEPAKEGPQLKHISVNSQSSGRLQEMISDAGPEESTDKVGASELNKTHQPASQPKAGYSEADPGEEVQFSTAPQQRSDEFPGTTGVTAKESIMASDKHDRDTEAALVAASSASRPALSAAVSEISTTDLLPSAQPRLEPQHSTSSVIKDDKLQSIKQVPSTSEGTRDKENGDNTDDQRAQEGTLHTKASTRVASAIEQHQSAAPGIQDLLPDATSDTIKPGVQQLPGGIGSLDVSTMKKPKLPEKADIDNPMSKAKTDKKRKKTSFVGDRSPVSSHGSIQDVMKAKISKKLDSPPLFLLGKDNLDVEVSDEEEESVRKRSRQSKGAKPKSILKSTNPTSSPTMLRRSKHVLSTGQEQDMQDANGIPINSGQNAVDADNFDLDGAIDDLGSFLGTWDAEKEASGLDIEI